MQPTFTPTPATSHRWKWAVLVLVLIALVLGGFQFYKSLTFHIVKTDPDLSKVGNYSPYLRVYFNEPVKNTSVKVSSGQDIISSTEISDKTITFKLVPNMAVGQEHTITIASVSSDKGKTLTNQKLTFTVKDIAITSLSKDQQQDIMGKVDDFPYTVYSMPTDGFDELTNNGLTTEQEQVIKQALFDYSGKINVQFTSVVLDTSTITPGAFDRNSADASRSLDFSVTANSEPYTLHVTYSDLDSATVLIRNKAGTVVYDNSTTDDSATDSVTE